MMVPVIEIQVFVAGDWRDPGVSESVAGDWQG